MGVLPTRYFLVEGLAPGALSRYKGATMSFKVEYLDKSGKACSAVFGSEKAANTYARSVKGGRVVPAAGIKASVVDATQCPVGQGSYYHKGVNAENRAELEAEHFMESRFAGQSMADACSDWDYIQSR